jgi:cardiolipin synthase
MNLFPWLTLLLHLVVAPLTAVHALLYKRDPKAAFGWIGVCLTFPVFGPLLYFFFGINRIQTRAKKLGSRRPFHFRVGYERPEAGGTSPESGVSIPTVSQGLARISEAVTRRPLVGGNDILLLHNGEHAYPEMLQAIDQAERSVYLSTYLFETNRTGHRFIEALTRATERGLDVRVILDGVGERYSFPRAGTLLRQRGVRVARFLPPSLVPPSLHINLRNHRKILVADGRIAFTGGMNIGDRHLAANLENPSRVVDAHFRLTGAVVGQLQEVFLEDWVFAAGEPADPPKIDVPETNSGGANCRTITDGPNEDLDKLATILLGAVCSAHASIMIMTPYFLPSREMIGALQTAALRGVAVTLILPGRNNLPFVHWATRNMLWELLQWGVRVYYRPGPFDHSKLFVIDHLYALIGSANMDPRSLRLNFELVVEIHDQPFAAGIVAHIEGVRSESQEVTLAEVDSRPLMIRVRDSLAWLFSPYL